MKKILLIDVSNLFFRAFYAIPSHFTMKDGTPSNAVYGVISTVFSLIEAEKPTHIFVARDLRGPTLRHEQIEGYKAGRPEMPEDLSVQLPFVFDFFENAMGLPILSHEGYEADDMIACLAARFRDMADCRVQILSNDQDLLQLVGGNITVLQPQNGGKQPKEMRAEDVEEKLGVPPEKVADYKALAGDSSDKLAGVPGIGPKGACAILSRFASVEEAIEHAGEISGKNGKLLQEHSEQALLTKKLATLHCDLELKDYDEDKGRLPETMPKSLAGFLEELGSGRLKNWARKLFGEVAPPAEQMGMF